MAAKTKGSEPAAKTKGNEPASKTKGRETAVKTKGAATEAVKESGSAKVPAEQKESVPDSKMRYLEKKETERVYRRLMKQVEESEANIAILEKEITVMDSRLATGDAEVVSSESFYRDYEKKKQELDILLLQWEKANGELEEFTADYMKKDDSI